MACHVTRYHHVSACPHVMVCGLVGPCHRVMKCHHVLTSRHAIPCHRVDVSSWHVVSPSHDMPACRGNSRDMSSCRCVMVRHYVTGCPQAGRLILLPSRGQMAALGSKEMTITERELLRRTSRRVDGGAPARPGWSLDDRSGQVGERARPFLAKPQSPTWLNLDVLNRAGNPRPGTRGTRGRPEGAGGRNSSAGTII